MYLCNCLSTFERRDGFLQRFYAATGVFIYYLYLKGALPGLLFRSETLVWEQKQHSHVIIKSASSLTALLSAEQCLLVIFSSPGAETAPGDSHMTADTELCVCVCLSQCIESVVGGDDYSQSQVNKWTASIVERCLTQLVKQHKPYKYIGTLNSVSPPPC